MRTCVAVLIILTCSAAVFAQTPEFCDRVLSLRDGRSNYFIPINVRSDLFTGKVVVESFRLNDYLKETKGFDGAAYKTYVMELLERKRELEIKDAAIDRSGFYLSGPALKKYTFRVVVASNEFDIVSAQGCKVLLKHYFSPDLIESTEMGKAGCRESIISSKVDLFMRPKYDLAEQNNVIAALFDMDIPISLDDISQSLRIGYLTLK